MSQSEPKRDCSVNIDQNHLLRSKTGGFGQNQQKPGFPVKIVHTPFLRSNPRFFSPNRQKPLSEVKTPFFSAKIDQNPCLRSKTKVFWPNQPKPVFLRSLSTKSFSAISMIPCFSLIKKQFFSVKIDRNHFFGQNQPKASFSGQNQPKPVFPVKINQNYPKPSPFSSLLIPSLDKVRPGDRVGVRRGLGRGYG